MGEVKTVEAHYHDWMEQEVARLTARVAELEREMRMHLPILNALERNTSTWEWYTDGTGVATLNGYRAALAGKENK